MALKKVLIIGAGLGGLTLAQSLRSAGIEFQLFERDASPWDRPQGYRLHLDADAINAAREVLPQDLFALFKATSQHTEPFTTILATDLSVIKRLPTDDEHDQSVWPPREGPPVHYNVDRATLRQILMSGLDGAIHFNKRLVRYETCADQVIAHFDDSTAVEGDVLVGADGIRSAVRAQRAPHAHTANAGVVAIYGRIPMDAAVGNVSAATLQDIFTIATDDRKVFLGLGSVRFPIPPDAAAGAPAPASLRSENSYVVCIVGGRPEYFPHDMPQLRRASSAELQETAARVLGAWPANASDLLRRGDPGAFFSVEMNTSVPCTLDDPDNVTLLGDAIHAMTPTLGRGANVAMRDAALLGRALQTAARGAAPLRAALVTYEHAMLRYGFDVVREAARVGQQRMAQNPLPDFSKRQ